MRIPLSRKDEKGVVWGLSGSSSTGKLQKFALQEGQVTSLAAGPPLRVKVQASQQGDLVSLGCSVLGQAGETYGAGATRAGVTQPRRSCASWVKMAKCWPPASLSMAEAARAGYSLART